MCTTIGFSYNNGYVFGRTLEVGATLDNKLLFIPKNIDVTKTPDKTYQSKYSILGSGFFNIPSFGEGINEKGLMGSNNLFPGYASFSDEPIKGMINTTTSQAFDYLLTRCANVNEVKKEAENINLVKQLNGDESASNHFFFMDESGDKVVLEPKSGKLIAYTNPFGVLTNAPEFHWHQTNLKNYLNLKSENTKESQFNQQKVTQTGVGTGMLGLPGDFTPPSRFIRAAYYVSNTPKTMERNSALLQGFRILAHFDIPEGAIIYNDKKQSHQTLYTSMMDTHKRSFHIKNRSNTYIHNFYLEDFVNENEITFIELKKTMKL
ncbi:linear amide C-N hydrolase [Alkalibacterium kapii]|uniref:Choloylglycine hydrolase n=1 Tax=Alkalibacterium kapii TaxID=426704 RepID=A0A511ATZ1_9LACT|nr:linear amide C-N hydrolase [Alkalibacterium kapii]GEK91658.1 choloylglycine hydrolase [Alkalibacterium kapii]